ncbi:MAG: hypothetical protein ACRD2N_23125 [Vicinamibacterales bacterium]
MTRSRAARAPSNASTILGGVVIASALLCVYAIRQADPDLFGYLAYGRLFVEQGVTAPDPFAYTSTGSQWVAFEYLAQVLLWIAYDTLGPPGLIALKCLLGGLAIYFLSVAVRTTTADPIVWAPVFLLCTSTVSRYFLFRPQLFTFMFFALYVAVLFRFLAKGKASLWLLPVTMLLWANTHGGFLAGLGAIALTIALRVAGNVASTGFRVEAAFNDTKRLWLTLAGCALISLINPHGIRLWQYVLTEVVHDTNRRYIAEWRPPGPASDPWSAVALTFITVVLLIAGWAAQVCHRRVSGLPPWLWICSCVPAIALAHISVRHVPLAALWAAPVITLLAAAAWRTPRARIFNLSWIAIGGCALVPIVVTMNHIIANPRPAIATNGATLGPTHPCTAVTFVRQNGLRGNLYTPLWWGAFITWELYPDLRVSMDGRNISLFSPDVVEESLRFYSDSATRRDLDTPLKYATDLLLVPADRPVVELARHDARWKEIFTDRQSSLFVRADSAHEMALSSIGSGRTTAPAGDCARVLR